MLDFKTIETMRIATNETLQDYQWKINDIELNYYYGEFKYLFGLGKEKR